MRIIIHRNRRLLRVALFTILLAGADVEGAELRVGSVAVLAGTNAEVVVSGTVAGEVTFGLTILVEIVPRVGSTGSVTFTPSPPVDIIQAGDPWPGGTFSAFDTDSPGFSDTLNGSVDEDGIFVCSSALTFSGPLTTFPFSASADAGGVWDVRLSTSAGDSGLECVETTTLVAGTITVSPTECLVDGDCDDFVSCTDDTCVSGTCTFSGNDTNCLDDGTFCNGTEFCDPVLGCISSGNPCPPGDICDETADLCRGCTADVECDDGNVCTDDVCTEGACGHTNNTASCDDGLFCTETDVCSDGDCTGSGDPCPGEFCDETNDNCIPEPASLSVNDLVLTPGDTAELLVSGAINGESTIGVSMLVELVPRPGSVGTVTFTLSPPEDIVQRGDAWPLGGIFSGFDTDAFGFSPTLNASVDDNGTFISSPVSYSGPLTGFPVTASIGAGGVWDVLLVGDSGWEGVTTALNTGTITVPPSTRVSVGSRSMPPGSTADIVVTGAIDGAATSSVIVLLEIVGRPGNVGTLTFTPSPPLDIVQLGDPWGGGTFSAFDTDSPGFSTALNASIHGVFSPVPVMFSGGLAAFPVLAGSGADGTWDLLFDTSAGESGWGGVSTALEVGTVTVTPGACVTDNDCDDGSDCTDDNCDEFGTCSHSNLAEGTVCGDPTANDCTDPDTCDGSGTCQAHDATAGTLCTDDGSDCTNDECDGAGTCTHPNLADGTTCTDDGNECTDDVCSAGACTHTNLPSGTGCGDPTATDCTAPDTCDGSGTCNANDQLSGTACTDDSNECTDDVCDGAGTCTHPDLAAGTACGDPTASDCTAPDTCDGFGTCEVRHVVAGTPCTDDLNVCTDDLCDGAGTCTHPNLPSGTDCNDGNTCNVGEACQAGVCVGGSPVDCSPFSDQCNTASCEPAGAEGNCSLLTEVPGGTACDDGDNCTTDDVCLAGACGGAAVDCPSFTDSCNVGVCNPDSGACQAQPANEGGGCDDGLPCTINDVCTAGTCSGTPLSPPAVNLVWSPATQTVQTGQSFLIDLVAVSDSCVDQPVGGIDTILNWDKNLLSLVGRIRPVPNLWLSSNFPNDSGLDRLNADCGEDLFCSPYTSLPFNDGDALYQAVQNFQTGVVVSSVGITVVTFEFQALDGTPGTSLVIAPFAGSFTRSRVLGAGVDLGVDVTGTLGTATVQIIECQSDLDCDDGDVCTTDTCNVGVCEHTNNSVPCDDGLFCTASDVCVNGACVGSGDPCLAPALCSEDLDACVQCLTAADCADDDICTDDVCDAFGACSNPNNTLPCNDELFCTTVDTCVGGLCVGAGDACPGEVCDEPNNRCVECLTAEVCDDANDCTDDFCTGNLCENIPNTLPCDDGLFCTLSDVCAGRECVGSGSPCPPSLVCSEALDACVACETNEDCDDGNLCTTDLCSFNLCFNTNNAAPCDDGLFCTTTDACTGGGCVGSGDACPGRLCDETNDVCVECFTVADCPDDGVGCTVDACVDGTCVFPLDDFLCDDGLFCNGQEFCHPTLDCRSVESPCDDPTLCNEVNDSCGCQEPVVVEEGSRFLAITPRAGSTPVALLFTGADLEVLCVSLYVQSNGTLGTTPVFKPPAGPAGWNTVHIRGTQVIPSTNYIVQAECETGVGLDLSTQASGTTWLWGDTDNSGGLVSIRDAVNILDGFQGLFPVAALYTFYSVDLWGVGLDDCLPQLTIDLRDVISALDAFQQFPFPCEETCP